MAISTLSDISPILTQAIGPELVRLWNRQANLLGNCVKMVPGEGPQAVWACMGASGSAQAVAEGYTVLTTDYNADSSIKLALSRAQYIDAFALSTYEISVAMNSKNSPTALFDMVGERVFECMTRLAKKCNTDSFSGNGTDSGTGAQNIVGLDSGLIVTGDYAGKTVTSITSVKSNVFGSADSGTGVALTLAQIHEDLTAINVRSNEKPEFIVVHPYVASKMQTLLDVNHRQVSNGVASIYANGPSGAFNGAHTGMFIDGIPVLTDTDGYTTGSVGAGLGHIYYVSKRHLELDVMPDAEMGFGFDQTGFLSSDGVNMDSFGGPAVSIIELARTGLSRAFAVAVNCQLKLKRPMAMGRRTNVAI